MPVEVSCANCAKRYLVPESAARRAVRCKACGQTFVADAAGTLSAERPPLAPHSGAALVESVGRFAVRGRLGAGAFGVVYRAYDPQLDREVALKVPNPGVMADPKHAERFLREAKAAANLRHPHIVPVFDAGRDQGSYYIASAFVDGKPLSEGIPESGTDFTRAARLVRELADALAYAHDQGIVHRDVKPQNVMLDRQDRVHLMDFGLASRQEDEARLTRDGTVMGTPAYMAPEQAAGQKGEAKPAADQYAAGVVLYELLTGRVPFRGPAAAVIHNAIHAEPEPPRKVRPDVPKDLEMICLKAMAKRPEDRYPACHALAADLRRWLEGEPVAVRRPGFGERAVRLVRKEPKLSAAVALLLVTLLTCVGLVSNSARVAEKASQEAAQEANEARAAGQRAADALADANAARTSEQQAKHKADDVLGKLGTATEERDNALKFREESAKEAKRAAAAEDVVAREQARGDMARDEVDKLHDRVARLQKLLNEARPHSTDAAYQALLRSSTDEARTILGAVPPARRGWEWAHVEALCDRPFYNPLVIPVKRDSTGYLSAAALSPDGKRVATAWSTDGKVRVWDASAGKELLSVGTFSQPVSTLAFNADGSQLVTYCSGAGRVWDTKSGELVRKLVDNAGASLVTVLSPDGTRLLASGSGNSVRIYNTSDWSATHTVSLGGPYLVGAAYGDGGKKFITLAANSRAVRLWDATDTKSTRSDTVVLTGEHTDDVTAVAYSPDGKWVATGGRDQRVCLWSAKTNKVERTLVDRTAPPNAIRAKRTDQLVDVFHPVNAVAFSPDGTRLVTGGADFIVRVWDTASGELLLKLPYPTAPSVDKFGTSLLNLTGIHTLAWDKSGDRLMIARTYGIEIRDRPSAPGS